VVTEAAPKYYCSRCLQVLISALPQGGVPSPGNSNESSQLHLRFAHQLILKTCRDLHLHPSESKTETALLSLQLFLCTCPIGVLLAQGQPLTEVFCAIIATNTASVMEAVGNVLLECNENQDSGHLDINGGASNFDLTKDDKKSMRLVMHCLRAICLLCRRCPKQMKTRSHDLLVGPLRMYLLLLPLHASFKVSPRQEQTTGCGASGIAVLCDASEGIGGVDRGGYHSARGHCQWLWMSVCVACQALQAVCPDEWKKVTQALTGEI